MNEKEKKSIKNLEDFAYTIHGTFSVAEAKTILNLIGKLQKENEELKIKNNAIKRESEAYAENMARLDNELNISKIGSDYWCMKYAEFQKENEELKKEIERQKDINTVINKKGLDKNYEKALEKTMTKFLKNNIANDFISKQTVKDKIKKYKKLGNEFYEKFLETNKTDINIHDTGISCDAKVQVLQELLEGK